MKISTLSLLHGMAENGNVFKELALSFVNLHANMNIYFDLQPIWPFHDPITACMRRGHLCFYLSVVYDH